MGMGNGLFGVRAASVAALVVAATLAGCAGDRPVPGASGSACVLLDTDSALDDARGIAALLGRHAVVGVVATEGISTPARGAMVAGYLIASSGRPAPVVVGAASASPSSESWLLPVRANAERLNDLVGTAVPMRGDGAGLEAAVERWTKDCADVRALVLGPWTSFVRYAPKLKGKLRQVVTQGKPLEELAAGQSPGFNCRYDRAACEKAHELLRAAGQGVWVDVPRGVQPPYAPTAEMVEALAQDGLPGLVRAAMLANRDRWKDTLMTDEAAVLFMLHPEAFSAKDKHMEPTVPPAAFRDLWLRAANRQP